MLIFTVQGVKLSPAARCFVPESFMNLTAESSVTQPEHCALPDMSHAQCYMTSYYPFVNGDYAHNFQ